MEKTSPEEPSLAQKMTQVEALARFGDSATAPDVRRQALSVLIGAKFLPKEADNSLVVAGRSHWIQGALHASDGSQKLLSIAESIRLGQVVKRWMPEINAQLASAFFVPLPPLSLLSEADDRLNVARACSQMDRDWLPKYMAESIANEETGEKARAEFVAALLTRTPTLADALALLTQSFDGVRPETEEPGETLAKRLVRTLSALRTAWMDCELETGPSVGIHLHRLVQSTLANVCAIGAKAEAGRWNRRRFRRGLRDQPCPKSKTVR